MVVLTSLVKNPKPHKLAGVSQFAFTGMLLTKGQKTLSHEKTCKATGMAEGVETLPLKKAIFQLPIIEIFQAEISGLIIAQG